MGNEIATRHQTALESPLSAPHEAFRITVTSASGRVVAEASMDDAQQWAQMLNNLQALFPVAEGYTTIAEARRAE